MVWLFGGIALAALVVAALALIAVTSSRTGRESASKPDDRAPSKVAANASASLPPSQARIPPVQGGTPIGTAPQATQIGAPPPAVDPKAAAESNHRGARLSAERHFDEAIQAFDEAIRLDPRMTGAWANRAHALLGLGRLDEAAQAANKALELSAAPKTRAVAELALGYVGARRGKFGDAEAAYQRALTQHPSYAAAKDAVQILSLCRRPTPALLAAVRIAVSGQLLAEPLVTNLSREERLILAAAPPARHGQLLDPPSIASFYYATQLPAGLQFKENSAAGLDVLTAEDRANEQLVKQSLSATNNPSRKSEERSNPF